MLHFSLSASECTLEKPLVFVVLADFPPPRYPLSLGRHFPGNLPLHPSPFFIGLPPTIGCSWSSRHHPWCSFVFVPSRPLGHQAESLQNLATSFVSCFFQDSPEIHVNIFWTSLRTQSPAFHFVTPLLFFEGIIRNLQRRRRHHSSSC